MTETEARTSAAALLQAVIEQGQYRVSEQLRVVVEQAITDDLILREWPRVD